MIYIYIYTYILYYCIIYITPETNHQPRVVLQSLLTTCLLYPKICWIDPLEISIWTQFPWISHMKHRWYRFMDVPFHIFPGFPWSTHVNLTSTSEVSRGYRSRLHRCDSNPLNFLDAEPGSLDQRRVISWWFHGDFIVISWGFHGI